MKTKLALSILAITLLCTGCMSMGSGMAKAITAASHDPACISFHLMTPYGSMDYSRSMPGVATNWINVPVTGQILVNPK
jgi:hypothetical protein